MRINESVEESAYRELKEETNLDNIYMEQLYTFGDVKRDPRMRIISTAYMALIKPENIELKAGGVRFELVGKDFIQRVSFPMPGSYSAHNAMAAAAIIGDSRMPKNG